MRLNGAMAFAYCAVFLAYRHLDVFNAKFGTPGVHYIVASILRISFPAWIVLVLLGTGYPLIRREHCSHLEKFILSVLCGFAVCNAIFLTLGLSGHYDWTLAFLFGLAGSFLSGTPLRDYFESVAASGSFFRHRIPLVNILLLALALLSATDLYIRAASMPVLVNDGDTFTHYMPYYSEAFSVFHGAWPTNFFFSFFNNKGNGPQLWIMSLTDINSGAMASLAFFVILASIMYYLVLSMYGNSTLALLGTMLLSFSTLARAVNFYKIHIGNALIYFGAFFSIYFLCTRQRSTRLKAAILMIVAGAIVYYPMNYAILSLLLVISWALTALCGIRDSRFYSVALLVSTTVFALHLFINFQHTGLPDIALPVHWKLSLPQRVNSWMGETSVGLVLSYLDAVVPGTDISGQTQFSQMLHYVLREIWTFTKLDSTSLQAVFCLLLLAAYAAGLHVNRQNRTTLLVGGTVLLFCLAIPMALISLNHRAALRFFSFLPVLQIFLLCGALAAFSVAKARAWLSLLTVLACGLHIHQNLGFNEWGFHTRMFRNEATFLSYYSHNAAIDRFYWHAAYHPGRYASLNSSPLAAVPGLEVLTAEKNTHPVIDSIAYSDPGSAADALRAQGIISVFLDTNLPLSLLALFPVFQPESLCRNFQSIPLGGGQYVFTLRNKPGESLPADCPATPTLYDLKIDPLYKSIYSCNEQRFSRKRPSPFQDAYYRR